MPNDPQSYNGPPVLLEVERFEQVRAGTERVLLRVDGRYGDRPGTRVLDAMLFVDDGLAVHRHGPLEDDGDPADGWLWRAAFEVPASYLTDARMRFALESEPGSLIDLPRPAQLLAAPAVPLTARAAHIARRYAAAVAIVLIAALAPGGLPAQARNDVLRVHHADGTIAYVTTDGQTLAAVPPEANVVDQPAPAAPAPAPTPAPTMSAAPQAPATSDQKSPDPAARGLAEAAASARGHVTGATVGQSKATGPGAKSDHKRPRHHHANGGTGAGQGTKTRAHSHAASSPVKDQAKSTAHSSKQPATTPGRPMIAPQAPAAPDSVAPLDTLPQLAVAGAPATMHDLPALVAGNDAQSLRPLDSVAPAPARPAQHHPTHATAALPSKGLQPLSGLAGGPDAGRPTQTTSAGTPPATGGVPVPIMDGVPEFFAPPSPVSPTPTDTPPHPADHGPSTRGGSAQTHSGSTQHATPESEPTGPTGGTSAPSRRSPSPSSGGSGGSTPAIVPTPGGTGAFSSLPGPAVVSGVPNFVIQKFHVPPFLLSIYQAAGIQYGIRWEVLAAINEIETDYGRNLNVSSAGALGWMQFMPATWKMYGTDANKDGKADPYNPVDAIFAAARYLKAAGGDKNIRQGIFAYNHAGWYVDSVMLRARLIAGYPPDLIGSLTGLTEGRFPVAARARYADNLSQSKALKQVQPGQNAANVVGSSATRRGIDIFASKGAPVVAVNDGVIKKIGRSKAQGLYVVLQDVYGNRYTYSGLGSLARFHPVPKAEAKAMANAKSHFQPVGANDPKPKAPASQGTQRPGTPAPKRSKLARRAAVAQRVNRIAAVKQRLFAHPQRPAPKRHGGIEQLLASGLGAAKGFTTYDNYFSHGLGLNSKNAVLKPLKVGSHVVGSTVLGRVGGGKDPSVYFEIQPAGKGAPKIDPKPFLDGWKLLESTAVYRAKGRNVLYGNGNYSIGEIMLLPKPLLVKRVLSDPRVKLDAAGRQDIATGQIDRRVLVVLEYLAESGLEPTVSCLKSGHSLNTSSGNISEHSSGNAVDIAAINGVSINGHQGPGDVAEQAVKRLMLLQGTIAPHQIISLLNFGQNTLAMPDHADHIHVGFRPLFGSNTKLGRETQSVLQPGQWDNLVQRLGQIQNPTVPTQPSRYAIPNRNGRGG